MLSLRDTKSILLILMSGCLVGTWFYHFYDKSRYTRLKPSPSSGITYEERRRIEDSIDRHYQLTLRGLDAVLDSTRLHAGALQGELNTKMEEIYRLRNEVTGIVLNRNLSPVELARAREKKAELEQRVQELEGPSLQANGNGRSKSIPERSSQPSPGEPNANTLKSSQDKTSEADIRASDFRLVPLTEANNKEMETSLAEQAEKLLVSFSVQNTGPEKKDDEVFVIVTQPDGKVLKTDVWESLSMDTRLDGRRSFTRRIRFDYEKGRTRSLQVPLSPDEFQPGTYQVEVYHNGYRIGQASRQLK